MNIAPAAQVHAMRWKTLGVLSLSLIIIGLDNTILNVALPTLQEEFDASASGLQWMVDSYLLVFAGLLLVFGTLGDRLGRKRALQAGVSIFGLASLGALVADSAGQLIAVRALMGVGAAMIMPATLSIIANVFPAEERGKAIGIWAALAALGIGLGPLAGGLLLEWFDWSAVFLVNVPFALAALLLGIRFLPESRDPRPGAFDLAGAALSTAGFSVLVYAVIEAPNEGWLSGLTLSLFGVSAVLLSLFLWWERRTADPMLDLSFFRSAGFSVGTVAGALDRADDLVQVRKLAALVRPCGADRTAAVDEEGAPSRHGHVPGRCLDAEAARAEHLGRGQHDAPVARAQVDHEILRRDVRHIEHFLDHGFRRRYPDDIFAFLADLRLVLCLSRIGGQCWAAQDERNRAERLDCLAAKAHVESPERVPR